MGTGASSKRVILPDMNLKMILIGSAGSGKSSVFSRITANQFSYHYVQTTSVKIGNIVKKINVPVECCISLALWDLPGLEDMDMRKSYYENIDAAVIVVNINDVDSFNEVIYLRSDLLELTQTKSELATFDDLEEKTPEETVDRTASNEVTTSINEVPKLTDLPSLLLGNKVDQLIIDEEQEELHPNVVALSEASEKARYTGWVPVSAKENDRSIDLAFTAFLRYIVEKKLNLEQSTGKIKLHVAGGVKLPMFVPPRTAATRLQHRLMEEEDENFKRLPLLQYEGLDSEYRTIRRYISKIRRGHTDWALAYRRFRKATIEYKVAVSDRCSWEEIILNIRSKLPKNSFLVEEFQGWIRLCIDENIIDTDEIDDDILEVIDTFNYELVPNATFVVTVVKNAQVVVMECKERLSSIPGPVSCLDQIKQNNKEIKLLLSMCEECISAVDKMRNAIEVAGMW